MDLNYIKKGENNNLHIVGKDEELFNHHDFNIYNLIKIARMETINKNMKMFNCEICWERKFKLNNPKDLKNETYICDRCEKENKELKKSNK